MKHFSTITKKPVQAMSVVEFDGMLAVFGRALTALTNSINFVLMTLGLPGEVTGIKGGGSEEESR